MKVKNNISPAYSLDDIWNGDIELGVIYWIYGVLSGLIFFIALIVAKAYQLAEIENIIFFISAIYYFVVYVGIWRSASKHQGNQSWSILAKFSVLLIAVPAAISALAILINLTHDSKIKPHNAPAQKLISNSHIDGIYTLKENIYFLKGYNVVKGQTQKFAEMLQYSIDSNGYLEKINSYSVGGFSNEFNASNAANARFAPSGDHAYIFGWDYIEQYSISKNGELNKTKEIKNIQGQSSSTISDDNKSAFDRDEKYLYLINYGDSYTPYLTSFLVNGGRSFSKISNVEIPKNNKYLIGKFGEKNLLIGMRNNSINISTIEGPSLLSNNTSITIPGKGDNGEYNILDVIFRKGGNSIYIVAKYNIPGKNSNEKDTIIRAEISSKNNINLKEKFIFSGYQVYQGEYKVDPKGDNIYYINGKIQQAIINNVGVLREAYTLPEPFSTDSKINHPYSPAASMEITPDNKFLYIISGSENYRCIVGSDNGEILDCRIIDQSTLPSGQSFEKN